MDDTDSTYEAVIVGGGPVGLFLGLCLERAGISCLILERRSAPSPDSRSLGIHPPSLELFESLQLADLLIREGIKITTGLAFANRKKIGSLSFEGCPGPYNFILALPQSRTEQMLEEALYERNPDILKRSAEVIQINCLDGHCSLTYQKNGEKTDINAAYIIGCDGRRSFVRKQAGIPFHGKSYPDTYVMGDFTDNTDLGPDAAVFLCDEGLIESFPLPCNRRRWVVKTNCYRPEDQRGVIERAVGQRIDYNLTGAGHVMLSSFGVEKRIARPMAAGRIILCGDAAHVVSPIGGQGMNLGWLGARDLADCLVQILRHQAEPVATMKAYEQRRKKAARNAVKRSELNMKLGRKSNYPFLRNSLVSLMLNTPLSSVMANLFTMRNIESGII